MALVKKEEHAMALVKKEEQPYWDKGILPAEKVRHYFNLGPLQEDIGLAKPINTIIQGSGGMTDDVIQVFASKGHAAGQFHRLSAALHNTRAISFSSISVIMGTAGNPVPTASNATLDVFMEAEKEQKRDNRSVSILWGPVGQWGVRRVYGSRDVFATASAALGQRLISIGDVAMVERILLGKQTVPGIVVVGDVDDNIKMDWEGKVHVKVQDDTSVILFKVRTRARLGATFDAFCERRGLEDKRIIWTAGDRALHRNDTIFDLRLEANPVIITATVT